MIFFNIQVSNLRHFWRNSRDMGLGKKGYNGIQIQYFFGVFKGYFDLSSTQKSTIRRHPFIHSFTK